MRVLGVQARQKYIVYRFQDSIRMGACGDYETLESAYQRAVDLQRSESQPNDDFLICAPAPAQSIVNRLPYKWTLPMLGAWYVLETSLGRLPSGQASSCACNPCRMRESGRPTQRLLSPDQRQINGVASKTVLPRVRRSSRTGAG